MSYSGEVYVEVDASVLGPSISPMTVISGDPEPVDGSATVVVWLRWQYDSDTGEGGFTGTGWYFEDPNNFIQTIFPRYEDFLAWLVSEQPTDLESVLGQWPAENKANFLNTHLSALDAGGCVFFTSGTSSAS